MNFNYSDGLDLYHHFLIEGIVYHTRLYLHNIVQAIDFAMREKSRVTILKRDKKSKPEGVFCVQIVTFRFKSQFSIVARLALLQGVRHFLQGDSHRAKQLQFSVILAQVTMGL